MHRVDVDAMLGEMDSGQLSEWMAYDRVVVSPIRRAAATISSVVANAMGDGRRQWSEADFLPAPVGGEEPGPMDDGEMIANLMGISIPKG